jgi:hypothetical protein
VNVRRICLFGLIPTLGFVGSAAFAQTDVPKRPIEFPREVRGKKVAVGNANDRAATSAAACQAAFDGFISGKLIASMGALARDFKDWTPAGKAAVLVPAFFDKRPASEGIGLCFVDGPLSKELTPSQLALANASDLQRALYLIGDDGLPVLYAIGSVDEIRLESPAIKSRKREYSVDQKRGKPPESIVDKPITDGPAKQSPNSVANEDAVTAATTIPESWKTAPTEPQQPAPSSVVLSGNGA